MEDRMDSHGGRETEFKSNRINLSLNLEGTKIFVIELERRSGSFDILVIQENRVTNAKVRGGFARLIGLGSVTSLCVGEVGTKVLIYGIHLCYESLITIL